MKIDFHTHTKMTKKAPFSEVYTRHSLRQAKLAGLDAICLTEHYNGLELMRTYEYIESMCQRDGDSLVLTDIDNEAKGLRVFFGLEVDAAEGGHNLLIGAPEVIKDIYTRLAPFIASEQHPNFEQLLTFAKQLGVLFGVAHPFRKSAKGCMPQLSAEQQQQFDFVDLNAKDVYNDTQNAEAQVRELARQLDKPVLAGSDTHQAFQYGVIYTQFEHTLSTISEIKEAMLATAPMVVHASTASVQIDAAQTIKRLAKSILKADADYVTPMFEKK